MDSLKPVCKYLTAELKVMVKSQSGCYTNEPFTLKVVFSFIVNHLSGPKAQKVDKDTGRQWQTFSKSGTEALCGLNYRSVEHD